MQHTSKLGVAGVCWFRLRVFKLHAGPLLVHGDAFQSVVIVVKASSVRQSTL